MADIDAAMKLLGAMNGKKEITANDMVNYAASKTLDSMFERLQQPHVTPDELRAIIKDLQDWMVSELQKVQTLVQSVDTQTGTQQVLAAIGKLGTTVNNFTGAVQGIQIPTPKVNIPEAKETDLTPVIDKIDNIMGMIATQGAQRVGNVVAEYVEETPKQWKFDVKRNQSGFIKSVEAKAVE